jgi:diadenosine tetraphosphatase ApaH/serine/threonine PP2A family protein phosphatase
MSDATRSWLAALPERRVLEGITLVHGSPRDPIREYISDRFVAEDNLAVLESRHALHGHTHVPVAWLEGGSRVSLLRVDDGSSLELGRTRALLNPGSVGQPRDGDPRAAYLVLDTDAGLVRWHRVPYEIAPVQAAIRAAGLPPRLADRLAVGA